MLDEVDVEEGEDEEPGSETERERERERVRVSKWETGRLRAREKVRDSPGAGANDPKRSALEVSHRDSIVTDEDPVYAAVPEHGCEHESVQGPVRGGVEPGVAEV